MTQIQYSEKYNDDNYEYRHVTLPPDVACLLPRDHLLSENEWRAFGIQQSRGWVHYAIHRPEPHIMLFRRPLDHQKTANRKRNKIHDQKTANRKRNKIHDVILWWSVIGVCVYGIIYFAV